MDATLIQASLPRQIPTNGSALSTSAPSTGNAVYKNTVYSSFQAISAAAATVVIEATNEAASASGTNNNWVTLGTITLSGAGSDGFAIAALWGWVRARVTAATAATTVFMGS